MKWLIILFFICGVACAQEWMPPEHCLKKLMEGNERFMKDHLRHPRQDKLRRQATLGSQWPCAVVLSCSDSRVPPEIIFDQGLGDVFVVRIAGNVVGPLEMDSIEFACVYLNASLIFVLGHENCGAVNAVLNGQTADIEAIATLIEPAVQESKQQKGDPLVNAIKNNVRFSIESLKKSQALLKLHKQGKLEMVGGYYELKSGKVSIIE